MARAPAQRRLSGLIGSSKSQAKTEPMPQNAPTAMNATSRGKTTLRGRPNATVILPGASGVGGALAKADFGVDDHRGVARLLHEAHPGHAVELGLLVGQHQPGDERLGPVREVRRPERPTQRSADVVNIGDGRAVGGLIGQSRLSTKPMRGSATAFSRILAVALVIKAAWRSARGEVRPELFADQQLIEHHAQGVHVACGQILKVHTLRRHVADGAKGERLGLGLAALEVRPGGAEVQHLHLTPLGDAQVRRLDVAVQRPSGLPSGPGWR